MFKRLLGLFRREAKAADERASDLEQQRTGPELDHNRATNPGIPPVRYS